MAATKSAGRVSIRVLPDSTRFKRDLETSLRRIERQMVAKIRAELFLSRESLAKLKRQIESLMIKIKPKIELNISAEDIAELKAKIESMKPKVDVVLNTVEASRRISSLTRDRHMIVHAKVLGLNSLASKLGAMSGFNVLLDTFRAGGEFISNIDRNAVKIGRMSTLIAGAMSGVVGLIGGLGVLGNDLAGLGSISILGPAFAAGAAIGITTLVLALKDMGKVLADLGPKFTDLQNKMSSKFWKEAERPVRELVKTLFPTLSVQLQETSRLMGTLFGEVARSVQEHATPEIMTRMFERMNKAIDISRGAISPLTRAFVRLGDHGSKYFERFSTWIVKLSNKFDNFIGEAAADGRLDKWTEDAITGFKDLGRALSGMTGIFGSIGRAAGAAGYGGLTEFANAMQRIDAIMNGERFQRAMSGIFAGMIPVLQGIKKGFINLGPDIEAAIPSFQRVMVKFGSIFEQALGFIGTFLSNGALQAGFERFIEGVDSGLRKLGPAMDPLATSLGGVFKLMGEVVDRVAGLVADMAIKLAPEFDKILAAIQPLLEPLNKMASTLIDSLKPVLSNLATEVLPPLVSLFEKLLPWVEGLVRVISPIAVSLMQQFAAALKTFVDNLNIDEGTVRRFEGLVDRIVKNMERQNEAKFQPKFGENGNLGLTLAAKLGLALGEESVLAREYGKWLEKQLGAIKTAGTTFKFLEDIADVLFDPTKRVKAIAYAAGLLVKYFDDLGKVIDLAIETARRAIKKKFQEAFRDFFGFGASGEDPNDATISGGSVGGKGMAPGAKIGPKIFNEEAEKTWLDTLFAGLKLKLDGFPATFVSAMSLWQGRTQPTWDTFWTGLGVKPNETWTGISVDTGIKLAETGGKIDTFKTNALVSWGIWAAETLAKTRETTGGADSSVTEKTASMAGTIAGWVAENQPKWVTAFETMKIATENNMKGSSDSTSTNMGTIAGTVTSRISELTAKWGPAWEGFKAVLSTAWGIMTGDTRTGVSNTANEAGQLPQKAKNSMGSLGTLISSGRTLVEGFAAGMRERLSWVESAAIAVAAMVAKHMPHSPAKAGPLSGHGYTSYSGRTLVRDFADGMMSNMAKVRKATTAVAEAARLGASVDFQSNLDQDGVVIDRRQVTVHNYNPVAEPTSRTIEKTANTLRMAKAI